MKYRVPYAIVIKGEFEVEAKSEYQAGLLARRHAANTKDVHRQLLEAGVGSIKIISDKISVVEPTPDLAADLTHKGTPGFGSRAHLYEERRTHED